MGQSLADGTAIFTDNALRTQYGIILPPGARVAAYVRSTGQQSGDDQFLVTNLVPNLAQGLVRARAGLGDFVVVLPGHVENVVDGTTFSNALITGTKIIGVGSGGNTPTFTWNATAASWNISVSDVVISGIRCLFDGVNAVVNAINITGSDVILQYNEFEVSKASNAPTTAITVGTGANRCQINGNSFRGLAASVAGNGILVSGAVSDVRIEDNEMQFPATSANGNINVTGVTVGLRIFRNYIYNTAATSVVAVAFANVASDGYMADNRLFCKAAGAMVSGTDVIAFVGGTTTTMGFGNNVCSNNPRTSGILVIPTPDT